jgi:hypothetical protein
MSWGILAGLDWSAIATLATGLMALGAAYWTIRATRLEGEATNALLRQQIEVQRQELLTLEAEVKERERRDKVTAAYTFFQLAGRVETKLVSLKDEVGQGRHTLPSPLFTDRDLILAINAAYPLAALLGRNNHIHFQLLDVVGRGVEQLTSVEHINNLIEGLRKFRGALTPVIVGSPLGAGSRIYSDGEPAGLEEPL